MGVPEREGVLEYISERSPRNLIVIFPEGVFLELFSVVGRLGKQYERETVVEVCAQRT